MRFMQPAVSRGLEDIAMHLSRRVVSAFSLCAMVACALIAEPAAADGGTISFAGAIVAPTCSIAAGSSSLTATVGEALVNQPVRRACSEPGHPAADTARAYAVSVARLSSSESDRVLAYFDSYVKAGRPDADDPVLVTQTYE